MNYAEMKDILLSISDPVMRLEMVMDFGKNMKSVPSGIPCHDIQGCSSVVKICRDGNDFYGMADSALVRGIVAIIIAMVDGKTPAQIRHINIREEFSRLGLNLGMGRVAGINSMISFLENL